MFDHRLEQCRVVADDHQAAAEGRGGGRAARRWSRRPGGWLARRAAASARRENRIRASSTLAPLPAGKRAQRLGQHAVGQAQAGGDGRRLGLGGVAPEHDQPFLQDGVPPHGARPGGRDRGSAHRLLGGAHRGPHLVQPARGQHPVHGQRRQVTGPRVLREVPDGAAAPHGATAGRPSPASTRASVVLPAPLRPDEAHLVPGADLEGGGLQQQLRASPQLQARWPRSRELHSLQREFPIVSTSPGPGHSLLRQERQHTASVPARRCAPICIHRREPRSRRPTLRRARSMSVPEPVVLHEVGPGRGGPLQPNRHEIGSRIRDGDGLKVSADRSSTSRSRRENSVTASRWNSFSGLRPRPSARR